MSAAILPFPNRCRSQFPTGVLGAELEALAVILQERCNRQPGPHVSLDRARAAAHAAYTAMVESRQGAIH